MMITNKLCIALLAVMIVPNAMAKERSLNDVLAAIDKQLRGVQGITGTATLTRFVADKQDAVSSGKYYANMDDAMRIDFEKPDLQTILLTEQTIYDYSPSAKTADKWSFSRAPQAEMRFMNLGFAVKGSDLTTDYIVTLLESAEWNTRQTTVLALLPKQEYRRAQAWSIVLRLDESSWLPVEQIIRYGASQTYLKVDYSGFAKDNNLKSKLFKPSWPSGTKTISH
jgi:outer membrane lipoprotein-sorting protein